jgi:enoyl-CoA hydratase
MSTLVTYELRDGIATISMDDGKRNALSLEMLSQLNGALDRARTDRAAVVLTGRAGVFSAGFDLRVFMAGGVEAYEMVKTGFELGARILAFPAPVVVACNGHAIAMGVFLVLSGDYRVGAAGEHRIGANEVAIGITMPHFGVEICRQRLAPAHFQRAVINAEIYRPEEAVAAGFLDRVVPAADLEDVAWTTAAELARLDRDVHSATKLRARDQALRAVRAAIEMDDAVFQAHLRTRLTASAVGP